MPGWFDKDLVENIKANLSIFALLAACFMYWQERQDRIAAESEARRVNELRVQEQKEEKEKQREQNKFNIDSFIKLAKIRDSKRNGGDDADYGE